jgi:hypothetical protein
MQEAITNYEKELRSFAFTNPKHTDCQRYDLIKQQHKTIRAQCLTLFKEKAVGQDLKEFEGKISEEIQKKYTAVRNRCIIIYERKCQEAIASEVEKLES